ASLADEAAGGGGPAGEASSGSPTEPSGRRRGGSDLLITGVSFDHKHSGEGPYILTGESMTIRIRYHAQRLIEDVVVGINVYSDQGQVLFGANNRWYPAEIVAHPGDGEFTVEFGSVPLLDGTYPVTLSLMTDDDGTVYYWHEQQYSFSVMNPTLCGGLLQVPAVIAERPLASSPDEPAATTVASRETAVG
ncbi:MAG: Wzt carbohydrate-binding domain-containing protein, partial [Acidimicrobiales bacterium]